MVYKFSDDVMVGLLERIHSLVVASNELVLAESTVQSYIDLFRNIGKIKPREGLYFQAISALSDSLVKSSQIALGNPKISKSLAMLASSLKRLQDFLPSQPFQNILLQAIHHSLDQMDVNELATVIFYMATTITWTSRKYIQFVVPPASTNPFHRLKVLQRANGLLIRFGFDPSRNLREIRELTSPNPNVSKDVLNIMKDSNRNTKELLVQAAVSYVTLNTEPEDGAKKERDYDVWLVMKRWELLVACAADSWSPCVSTTESWQWFSLRQYWE